MPYKPKLDLSSLDLLAAKDKLFECVCATAKSWGMDPDQECFLLAPERSRELGYGHFWTVMWESGPYNWGVDLSLDGVTFVELDGPFDPSRPEIVMGKPDDWYLEPYHSWDVGFVSNSIYSDFDVGVGAAHIITATGFFAQHLV